jgi:RHS repeat-associated protein
MIGIKNNAFGMVMPERSFSFEKYRWGFNGKETDNETNWQDYGFRIYYPGLAKFLSVDPLTQKYPFYSTYQFAANMPIIAKDIDGKEADLSPILGPLFKSAGITTATERMMQDKVDEVAQNLEKPSKITKDVLIIAGGVTPVLTSGGAAIPLVSGYIAVIGGTAKLTFDAYGEYNKSDAVPTTIPSAVMVTVNYTVKQEVFSDKFMAYVDIATGVPSLDLKGWTKLTSFEKANQSIEVVNFSIDASNLAPEAKKDMERMFNALQNSPKPIINNGRPLGAPEPEKMDNVTVNKILPLPIITANPNGGSTSSGGSSSDSKKNSPQKQ